ncbi:MAG: sigma-70 family RNA polymerase sigma factor [Verrucomicrobiota bacterium]
MSAPTPNHAHFLRLFLQNESDLRAYVGALVREPAAREDVFQEISLTLWESFEKYDTQRSFGAWARGVATNKILQMRRANSRLPIAFPPEAIERVLEAFDATEEEPGSREEALRDCLGTMPEKSQSILKLRYEDKLSCKQVAKRLRRSLDSVYQHLSRLRSQLEDCIERRLSADDLSTPARPHIPTK